ncbi:MAG: hypothetical protein LBH35_01880 [Treponema sp.]|jgi:hypothetical protein|nr:hypothetical protein [Treponema sp.]
MNAPSTNRAFAGAVKRYRALVNEIAALPDLAGRVQDLVDRRDGPSYTVQKPVVYNEALDDDLEIRMILVADNPGRREQEQGRYLVGPSAKIAETFFRNNGELGIDFRKNALILNKTPIHTPRTAELKNLCVPDGARPVVVSSQRVMAELLYEFWGALRGAAAANGPPKTAAMPVWIIGYSEMKKGGIFEAYTETLGGFCAADPLFRKSLLLFRHFSMNQFSIDLRKQALPGETVSQSLMRIGAAYRERIVASFLSRTAG